MFLDQEITRLELGSSLVQLLRKKDILLIRDLWNLNRKDLKNLGIQDSDINQIMIKMQLQGIDFNRKVYVRQ